MRSKILLLGILVGLLTACSGTPSAQKDTNSDDLMRMFLQGRSSSEQSQLQARINEAEKHPLGSRQNPVRVDMPAGQRAYLLRLRCADGSVPQFNRSGNGGPGVYGSIVDIYQVDCGAVEPGKVTVWMDMYFPGNIENRPVPGFDLYGGKKSN